MFEQDAFRHKARQLTAWWKPFKFLTWQLSTLLSCLFNACTPTIYNGGDKQLITIGRLSRRLKRLRWSTGIVLAFGTKVRGFKPDRSRRIFQDEKKILSTPSFGREVKPSVLCRIFTACKRSLNVKWKSGIFRQNSSGHFSPK